MLAASGQEREFAMQTQDFSQIRKSYIRFVLYVFAGHQLFPDYLTRYDRNLSQDRNFYTILRIHNNYLFYLIGNLLHTTSPIKQLWHS